MVHGMLSWDHGVWRIETAEYLKRVEESKDFSAVQALDLMSKQGWEVVSAVNTHRYLLRKQQ